MSFRKDYLYYAFLLLPSSAIALLPLYIVAIHGFNKNTLVAVIILSPLSIISIFICRILMKAIPRKIRLTPDYLVIDDFTPSKFPWSEIEEVSYKVITKGGPMGKVISLIIESSNPEKYKTKNKWLGRLNDYYLDKEIVVCNLATYRENPSLIVSQINEYRSKCNK